MTNRKGARRLADVPSDVLESIEHGEIDTANHIEQMAVRMSTLLRHVEPTLAGQAHRLDQQSFVASLRVGGQILFDHYGPDAYLRERANYKDLPRGWQAFAVGADPSLHLADSLAHALVYADDSHFAVREWAWLSVRPEVLANTAVALELLQRPATEASPRKRRFAIEATRPRSVWGSHSALLKEQPEMGEALLDLVMSDTDRYVQTSAANWIRDAAKTRPDWALTYIASRRGAVGDPWFVRRLSVLEAAITPS